MSMTTTFYCVSGKTAPWTSEMEKTVGFYSDEKTARKVCDLIREINMPKLLGGIDVIYKKYQGEVVRTPAGLRLKETPRGCITMIKEELSLEELQRLVNFKFQYKEMEVSRTKRWKLPIQRDGSC